VKVRPSAAVAGLSSGREEAGAQHCPPHRVDPERNRREMSACSAQEAPRIFADRAVKLLRTFLIEPLSSHRLPPENVPGFESVSTEALSRRRGGKARP
jgi:hypothetical protein